MLYPKLCVGAKEWSKRNIGLFEHHTDELLDDLFQPEDSLLLDEKRDTLLAQHPEKITKLRGEYCPIVY